MTLIGKKLCGAGGGVLLVPGSCRAEILRKVSLSAINRLDSVNISDFEFAVYSLYLQARSSKDLPSISDLACL